MRLKGTHLHGPKAPQSIYIASSRWYCKRPFFRPREQPRVYSTKQNDSSNNALFGYPLTAHRRRSLVWVSRVGPRRIKAHP